MTASTTRRARTNVVADSTNDELSDYEKLRLAKIKRNEDRMKELGLFRSKDALATMSKKQTKTNERKNYVSRVSPERQLPQRRSSRKRKTIVDYSNEQVIPMYEDEEYEEKDDGDESVANDSASGEDDYEASDNEDDEDDDYESLVEDEPSKKRFKIEPKSNNSIKKHAPSDTSFACVNPKGGLTLERAKTGRSSCRKCRDKIEKGAPRVGMEAWIVGRQAITWQHPKCLLENTCCMYEKSNGGKGKCKASQVPFTKGQLKIGIRCHTATSYYRIESFAGVLSNVVSLMRSEAGFEDVRLTVDGIDGSENLSTEDRESLAASLETVFEPGQQGTPVSEETNPVKEEEKTMSKTGGSDSTKTKQRDQPKVGTKSGAKGRVEWKFGGRSCYGTLIPRMETKTHCYARTHKGNVKTLAKGKDYWSMLE